ncbi:hypothetical protein Lal_00040147 [Lupinus albus]|uniref:Putative cyclic phosphodiesterase n=1 Tax=Lupinus albus TaxID=3870 RepID=A0A6A4QZ40_LUPAL|nr:putative cyclic phosphodiesterase [Lupinus albus]KAF1877432.1 hypothetical protein Lal_00040147 [Lupinus albus]
MLRMSEGYAIELYFDPALENQVLKSWNILSRRQITSHLIQIQSRPHITLFSSNNPLLLEPSTLQTLLSSFASTIDPFPITFSSISSFPSSNDNSFFLSPTPSFSLLNLQSQLSDSLKKEGIHVSSDFSLDSWIPFCSVAQNLPKQRMAEAFSVLRDFKLPVTGYAMDIGVVEFSPLREVFSVVLGTNVEQP